MSITFSGNKSSISITSITRLIPNMRTESFISEMKKQVLTQASIQRTTRASMDASPAINAKMQDGFFCTHDQIAGAGIRTIESASEVATETTNRDGGSLG